MASKTNQTKEELQKHAEALFLPISGTKDQLRDRLNLYYSISKLTKEELAKRAKKDGIELRKDTVKEQRAEYVKKRSGPINPPTSSPKTPTPTTSFTSSSTQSIYILPSPASKTPTSINEWPEIVSNLKEEISRLKEEKVEWKIEKARLETIEKSSGEKYTEILTKFVKQSQTIEDLERNLEKCKDHDSKITDLEEIIKKKDQTLARTLDDLMIKMKKMDDYKAKIKSLENLINIKPTSQTSSPVSTLSQEELDFFGTL